HEADKWIREREGPWAAVAPRLPFGGGDQKTTGFSGFTLGGLSTDVDGRVRHTSGELIPGLYAAGRASSGMHGEGYISGTSLGDGTFFGRRAGSHAARSLA